MSLASMGAKGKTFDQIVSGLRLSGDKKSIADQFSTSCEQLKTGVGNSTLDVANKVYVKTGYEIQKSFAELAVKSFRSEVENVNFEDSDKAAQTINSWIEGKTNNKIKNLIGSDALDEYTRLVLVNAIYFKGNWTKRFKTENTHKAPFWLNEGKSVDVDFMQQKEDFRYGEIESLDATALEMKYEGSNISFLILLPNKRNNLAELESKLSNFDLSQIDSNLYKTKVDVKIPKFKIEFSTDVSDNLRKVCIIVIVALSQWKFLLIFLSHFTVGCCRCIW